jgi:hypothetical protein
MLAVAVAEANLHLLVREAQVVQAAVAQEEVQELKEFLEQQILAEAVEAPQIIPLDNYQVVQAVQVT